jgi:hypothetical protein
VGLYDVPTATDDACPDNVCETSASVIVELVPSAFDDGIVDCKVWVDVDLAWRA